MILRIKVVMSKDLYEQGYIYCSACNKFLSPIEQADKIEVNIKSGQLYHKKQFCIKTSTYASRLRLHSRGRVARTKRQEEATYY